MNWTSGAILTLFNELTTVILVGGLFTFSALVLLIIDILHHLKEMDYSVSPKGVPLASRKPRAVLPRGFLQVCLREP